MNQPAPIDGLALLEARRVSEDELFRASASGFHNIAIAR
jgi:hypothetical protein